MICFGLTSFRPFNFLGEPERYLEYALPGAVISAVLFLHGKHLYLLQLATVFTLVSVPIHWGSYRRFYGNVNADWKTILDFYQQLNSMPAGNTLALGSVRWELLYLSNKEIVCLVMPDTRFADDCDLKMMSEHYPFPTTRFDELAERFDIRYVVGRRDAFDSYKSLPGLSDELFQRRTELVLENELMCLYQVCSS